jgi:hypothetical protein
MFYYFLGETSVDPNAANPEDEGRRVTAARGHKGRRRGKTVGDSRGLSYGGLQLLLQGNVRSIKPTCKVFLMEAYNYYFNVT